MGIPHIVVLFAALLTLLCLPCLMALSFHADEPRLWLPRVLAAVRGDGRVAPRWRSRAGERMARRWWTRRGRHEIGTLRRLDRALRRDDPIPSLAVLDTPSIEQLAFDLRRLGQQRRGGPSQHSEKWRAAVLRAYDERLRLACRALGLTEHLGPLQGMDRDLERLRVESELQAAGLALR